MFNLDEKDMLCIPSINVSSNSRQTSN